MSGRGEVEQRFQRLREISGIMTAMKSLSLVETRKLARFIGHQQRMLANIETAAADFCISFRQDRGENRRDDPGAGRPGARLRNFDEHILAALRELPPSKPAPRAVGVAAAWGKPRHPDVLSPR
jgi:F-type H+-transporting ATPase subunit gamma